MKSILVSLFSIILINGCTLTANIKETVDQAIQGKAEVNDDIFSTTEKIFCNGVSIGSIKRRFDKNPTMLVLYFKYCGVDVSALK
jgi:hypothetical protein